MLEVGKWYLTKREFLCKLDTLKQDGSAIVQSHYSGNFINIPIEQTTFFKETDNPGTEPGTEAMKAEEKVEAHKNGEFDHLYEKYAHIIPDSIYRVQNISRPVDSGPMFIVLEDGKKRFQKKKIEIKGATRCVIQCQNGECKNTRDIKVQDAFHVTMCEDCKKILKKKNLDEFLKDKKPIKKVGKKKAKKKNE